ncbi:immunity 49 family protein [Streptomyces sp. NPDC056254]|uniref:immunity 49 family protein n=1 Tax=Streptomyces sp. NPDC056254 TaxID=3345763 RepID=UPI0035E0B071
MTVTVATHLAAGPDAAGFAARLSASVARRVDTLEESADAMDFAFSTAILALQAHCVADPEADTIETWQATVTAMQLGSALFAVTGTREGIVECFTSGRTRTLKAIGPQPFADAGNWLLAYWLAVICREQRRMTELSEVPLERLRSADDSWVETLQSFWLRRDDLRTHLVRAVDLSAPDQARVIDAEEMGKLRYPPIMMLYRYLRNDAAGFNEALADAVRWHKEYWTADEDRAHNILGVVAIAPLAIACLAKANGIPVEVETDHLPQALLDFAWRGEFDA